MNTTDDNQPLGESPDVTGIACVDAAAVAAKRTQALQAAIDDIKALADANPFNLKVWQVRNILDFHGV